MVGRDEESNARERSTSVKLKKTILIHIYSVLKINYITALN
jgi:hypothetical protein